MSDKSTIFWFRRDLRLDDNVGFQQALKDSNKVIPIFIFDSNILEELPEDDARVTFIFDTLQEMRSKLQDEYGSSIAMYHGKPEEIFEEIIEVFEVESVYTNRDYEPYARERDEEIGDLLKENDIDFKTFKDQVIFEKSDVLKNDGDPYVVYTPYMKSWKEKFKNENLSVHYTSQYLDNLVKNSRLPNLSLSDMGFKKSKQKIKDFDLTPTTLEEYDEKRNFPASDSTTHLGPHLRFGTIGIRKVYKKALELKKETFWNELIWREFFMQILWHFPHTVDKAYKSKYDDIKWRNNENEFELWCEGKTGYPIVDAGMRQLNQTGFMHNRVRMIVGSFLCKHLLIDWRWGEAYFAKKLHDYELSSNVGNWQWVAGSGVDAAPYFRIFNPTTQIDKFDKNKEYIKKWVEEYGSDNYPEKMVDHKEARERALKTYKEVLN